MTREFFVRHKYWTIRFLQEQNEWVATCSELPALNMRGRWRVLLDSIPEEIERLVPEQDRVPTVAS